MKYLGLCKNVTQGRTHGRTYRRHFYNLLTMAFGRRCEITSCILSLFMSHYFELSVTLNYVMILSVTCPDICRF